MSQAAGCNGDFPRRNVHNCTSSEWPNMPSAGNLTNFDQFSRSLKSIYSCCFQDRTSLGLGNAHFELLSSLPATLRAQNRGKFPEYQLPSYKFKAKAITSWAPSNYELPSATTLSQMASAHKKRKNQQNATTIVALAAEQAERS